MKVLRIDLPLMIVMLIVDGVRYKPWTPKDEEKEFHPLVKAQSEVIFGKDIIYFDVKTLIRTDSGIGSIPDAYVVKLCEPYEWFVIENELATHPVYDHVVRQLTKFINGIENKNARNQILDLLYEQINKDNSLRSKVSTKTGSAEIYHFLSKLILTKKPRIVVIIDEVTQELEEAAHALSYTPDLVEFRTFTREDNSKSYAHLFEPLIQSNKNQLSDKASKSGLSQINQEYCNFYTELSNKFKEELPNATAIVKPIYYCQIPTGIGSIHYEWMFKGNPRNGFGVELHFEKSNRGKNLRFLNELEKSKDEIEKALGEKVIFQPNWGKVVARLYIQKNEGRMTEELKRWAIEKMVNLYNILQPKLKQIGNQIQ
jgi:hypothetical protein